MKVHETVTSSTELNGHIAAHMTRGSRSRRVETSDLIRPFVGSEKRGACERLRRIQIWNYRRLQTSSARRMQVMELSYPVEEASPPSRGVKHGRAIDVLRTSMTDDLMTDGEPMPSVKAAG